MPDSNIKVQSIEVSKGKALSVVCLLKNLTAFPRSSKGQLTHLIKTVKNNPS